jgi:hypothetical protein
MNEMKTALLLHGGCVSRIRGCDESEILALRKLILNLDRERRISRSETRDRYPDPRS